jgi:hypothetical protein
VVLLSHPKTQITQQFQLSKNPYRTRVFPCRISRANLKLVQNPILQFGRVLVPLGASNVVHNSQICFQQVTAAFSKKIHFAPTGDLQYVGGNVAFGMEASLVYVNSNQDWFGEFEQGNVVVVRPVAVVWMRNGFGDRSIYRICWVGGVYQI